MIDDNEKEIEAMQLFREGKSTLAQQKQSEFLEDVKKSGIDHCSCPAPCRYHGKCIECVIIHRGHSDHLPHCFQPMVNRRIKLLSALTEHTMQNKDGQ